MQKRQTSRAEKFFSGRPQLRDDLSGLEEFRSWLDKFPEVAVDQERLFVVGGDMLKDFYEMLVIWAVETGRLRADDVL